MFGWIVFFGMGWAMLAAGYVGFVVAAAVDLIDHDRGY